jgi:hypothetical protein
MARPGWTTISTPGISTALHCVLVIMENGRLVGTQIVAESEQSDAARNDSVRAHRLPLRDCALEFRERSMSCACGASESVGSGERERFHESLIEKIGAQE